MLPGLGRLRLALSVGIPPEGGLGSTLRDVGREEKRSEASGACTLSLNSDIFVTWKAWKMSGKITGAEEDSGCCDHLTPVVTTETALGSSEAKSARNAGKNKALVPKCISDKKFIIAAIILVVVLIIIIISLAVKNKETCPHCPSPPSQGIACPDNWIGYKGKCFYISKEERNWSLSLMTCSSFNASLAVIDTQKELDFWVNILNSLHYWFGLSREANKVWKWSNGTEFKTQFPVRGDGFCAYIDTKGASSTICSMEKHFLCSQPESCSKAG